MKGAERKCLVIRSGLLVILLVLVVGVGEFVCEYTGRFQTIRTIEKVTDYEEYNLYRMDVKYEYDLDRLIEYGITDDQSLVDAIVEEALPILPVQIDVPDFGCSAFTLQEADGDILMGRNYDFRRDTSAMLVYCEPEDGYKSVGFAALDNISANTPEESMKKKLATLTAPFICLDGMNEKGVSIAVLTLDSEPVHQNTGKPVIGTTLAIRLILDRAASTAEAVELLQQYDMFASSGRDYHFYITDSTGDGRVIEYDCESEARKMVATPVRSVTNFFALYEDQVLPNQRNGIYGHGKERYDKMEALFDYEEVYTKDAAWEALKAAAQEPSAEDITSNTQWSIIYDDTNLTAEIILRRNWENVIGYDLKDNTLTFSD
ncbi:MAG TPA: penicillin acylase [Blautia sp.]|nr:penicillin acylase [Blautia sp.]